MTDRLNLTIDSSMTGRIDKELAHHLTDVSRSQLHKWIEDGNVTVNGASVKPKYKLVVGDEVVVQPENPQKIDLEPENIPLDIVYEDEDVIVVNKPQGMVVHPAPGHPNHTLVNALLYHSPLSTINGEFRPGIVHRIDKDTSGLLMVAKNDRAHRSLAAQLKAKTNQREYIALVHGVIKEDRGTIDAPLGRSKKDRKKQAVVEGGRHAVTNFKVLERFTHYTLVSCQLETGRTHQIRVHMKYIGHPLAGDPLYGPRKTLPGNGQYLHARLLGFKHPRTGEQMSFTSDLPDYFQKMIDHLEKNDRPS
ncbi:RluA family pseudouridine synthase [Limosilactobacillus fastidiosus]|uniref:Pseudouridine synthase n=2 Tax=Limosilactobacillus fastidiosus TaxID=2759855 RepID=A0A7W3YC17_9LACO|nr:RluA family pseudouridine synthase [Limosilactobacillus fastidiosus]MBB1063320.1 RluA family pseudouridine synthase [Limosilactobacillus fastidiosus]MBB1086294.1 RluA family pseudouridine synthase [Limosilactobacillus fastidiosus]MCD7084510.1 RluA family pseudouridine synthase [Limosilactobacillus fastidiosus]MCD7086398.1 RluA family pseudouridine synthase [Limosilactobacillus fastidiosus]MCD7114246.1 RluA family pseudouridine synthase [Limosilactobacillus fastidiosus]